MILKVQVLTILVSIIYGCISYILFIIFKKNLLSKKILKKLVSNFIFILFLSTTYFLLINYINNAILTIYSYLSIIIGIFTTKRLIKELKTYKK